MRKGSATHDYLGLELFVVFRTSDIFDRINPDLTLRQESKLIKSKIVTNVLGRKD